MAHLKMYLKSMSIIMVCLFVISFLGPSLGLVKEAEPILYSSDTQPIGNLNIGDKVIDTSWEWLHRTGFGYSGSGVTKPVTWIVVGKNHFNVAEGQDHVTLLSEDIIGLYTFDNSLNRGSPSGSSHWGNSGISNATHGLRPFLNSLNKGEGYYYAGNGFLNTFSSSFQERILETTLPNSTHTGSSYDTVDKVFILSQTELGGGSINTHAIGNVLPYFDVGIDQLRLRRRAKLPGIGEAQEFPDDNWWYWTRSPYLANSHGVRDIDEQGSQLDLFSNANDNSVGMRPALNLSSNALITANPNGAGVYEIKPGVYEDDPTEVPTDDPTDVPPDDPTEVPPDDPTDVPPDDPTDVPPDDPTDVPPDDPTEVPPDDPTEVPPDDPTEVPPDDPTEEPEIVEIPDVNLKEALLSILEKEEGEDIFNKELVKITNLNLSGKSIEDITGLEYAKNLQELNLSGNNVQDISLLSELENLERLHISDNKLEDIDPLADLQGLFYLNLSKNIIVDIGPLEGLTNLQWLSLADNKINSIDSIKDLTNLYWLYLTLNYLDISFGSKDMSVINKFKGNNTYVEYNPQKTEEKPGDDNGDDNNGKEPDDDPVAPPDDDPGSEPDDNNHKPIADLAIGDKVIDYSWTWEHKNKGNYTGSGDNKPVTWIVVGIDHYSVRGGMPHVTLLSQEIIALHAYDDSTNRGSYWGSNYWGDSGFPDAKFGLRSFLNSLYIRKSSSHTDSDFYDTFSQEFKDKIIATNLPNSTMYDQQNSWIQNNQWRNYNTIDRVFILSETELGGDAYSPKIGNALPYFDLNHDGGPKDYESLKKRRMVDLPESWKTHGLQSLSKWYWTRSSPSAASDYVYLVDGSGEVGYDGYDLASRSYYGVRPALNMSADTLVTAEPDYYGAYVINHGNENDNDYNRGIIYGDVNGRGSITVDDAILILRYMVGLGHLNEHQIKRAKVNDGIRLSIHDAILILRRVVGLVEKFPVEY